MSRLLPPSPKRARKARALGLRPRSGLLVLAGLALIFGALLELAPSLAGWLSDQLDFARPQPLAFVGSSFAAWSGAALLALLGVIAVAVVTVAPRSRARRALGTDPADAVIPSWSAMALILTAMVLSITVSGGVVAAAARSVDASIPALTFAWLAWARRGLFALAGTAAGVGVIERLLSARRIWRGLHQTPAQARREARAAGSRGRA